MERETRAMLLFRLLLALLLFAGPAMAAPRSYIFDGSASQIAFFWTFGPDTVQGRMAVATADLALDLQDVGASRVSVTLDVTQADAGHPLATQALLGPRVLDARSHPVITFQSRRVTLVGDGHALVDGDLGIRGVVRPITLDARLTSTTTDLSDVTVRLRGIVHRSEFGASGWSDIVGDEVHLDIVAALRAAE